MKNSILEIFNIDNIKYKTLTRCLFGFLFLLNLISLFVKVGDSDFTGYFDWYDQFMTAFQENNIERANELMNTVPLTKGNIIYIAFSLLIAFITFMGSMLYCGLFVKSFRELSNKESISFIKLISRLIILALFLSVVGLPLGILLLSLFVIFIIILPWIIMYPACYLSGDYSFFSSFRQMRRKVKGYYLINAKNIAVIFLVAVLCSYASELICSISMVAGVVIQVFLETVIYLSFGRYIAMTYCRITDMNKSDISTEESDSSYSGELDTNDDKSMQ